VTKFNITIEKLRQVT